MNRRDRHAVSQLRKQLRRAAQNEATVFLAGDCGVFEFRVDPAQQQQWLELLEPCLMRARSRIGEPKPTRSAASDYPEPGPNEKRFLTQVLREAGWNITRASRRLGIPRGTLRYRIARYQLDHLIPKD